MPIDLALGRARQIYEETIRQAIKFEEQLRKKNIETMMMQGARNLSVNITELQEKIDIINYLQNIQCAVNE